MASSAHVKYAKEPRNIPAPKASHVNAEAVFQKEATRISKADSQQQRLIAETQARQERAYAQQQKAFGLRTVQESATPGTRAFRSQGTPFHRNP